MSDLSEEEERVVDGKITVSVNAHGYVLSAYNMLYITNNYMLIENSVRL